MRIFDTHPPNTDPISLDMAKRYLRIDHNGEDDLINDFITLAKEKVERDAGVSLITREQTFARALPPGKPVYLNCYPVSQIIAVRILTNAEQLDVSNTAYRANLKARPALITLTSGQNWSAAFPDAQGIEIDFIAGFGEAPDDIPMALRQAMLLLIAQSYEHRGDEAAPTPMMVDALLMPYRGLRL